MNGLPPRIRYVQNHNHTQKYRVCQERITPDNPDTRDWLTMSGRASHDLSKYAVFYAVLDKEKDVVVKVGPDVLKKEYAIGKQLEELGLPTFIQYYCLFDCLDDKDVMFDKKKLPEYFCKHDGTGRIHALVMPTIKGDIIENINWNRKTFPIFKNILKHVVLSLFCAVDKYEFAHGDLHTGNILIKTTKPDMEIDYGKFGKLNTHGFMPVIMDYDMSKINEPTNYTRFQFYKDLYKYISNSCSCLKDLSILNDDTLRLINKLEPLMMVGINECNQICDSIDNMEINFVRSEMSVSPWLRPVSTRGGKMRLTKKSRRQPMIPNN